MFGADSFPSGIETGTLGRGRVYGLLRMLSARDITDNGQEYLIAAHARRLDYICLPVNRGDRSGDDGDSAGNTSISASGNRMYILIIEGIIYSCVLSSGNHRDALRVVGMSGADAPVKYCSVGGPGTRSRDMAMRQVLPSGRRQTGSAPRTA